MKKISKKTPYEELLETFLLLKTTDEAHRFLKDLCTPQEISALTERWRVCKLLNAGKFSYREINQETGASLATITRVARFLKTEPHNGYRSMLATLEEKKSQSIKDTEDEL